MLFNAFMFVLGIMALVFSIPALAIWTEHKRKMAEMQLRLKSARDAEGASEAQVRELAKQLAELRSTATEYDLSFDSALQRLESRMNLLDERLKRIEGQSATVAQDDSNEIRLGAR